MPPIPDVMPSMREPAAAAPFRPCPLLERVTPTRSVPYGPVPWRLRECLESGFVYLENPPLQETFIDEHAWEVTCKAESARREAREPVLYALSRAVKGLRGRVLRRNRMRDLALAELRRLAPDSRSVVVDLGCGWGGLLQEIRDALPARSAARVAFCGIELSAELARLSGLALARIGGECIHATALEGVRRFAPGTVDLILMSSFLEHEINPMPLLRASHAALRPGGSVVLKVPNYGSWNRVVRGDRWCGFRFPDHVNYFAPATLGRMAERAGLRVARIDALPTSDSMYAVLANPGG